MHYMESLGLLFLVSIILKEGYTTVYTIPPDPARNLTSHSFQDEEADFGSDISDEGLNGVLVIARPLNACISVARHKVKHPNVFALVEESKDQQRCRYDKQVRNCQNAGYQATIVYGQDNKLRIMAGNGPSIPSVYVTKDSGEALKKYTYKTGASIKITPNSKLPLQLYLIPFAVVVAVCFFFMIIFSLVRYCRYRLRQKRSRLSPKKLKKIPTKKFQKGDDFDVCAICLDDYEEGEKIRILPCQHAYHCKCVDPWLTAGKKLCPVCKQSVEPKENIDIKDRDGGTSSSPEDGNHSDETDDESDADERTPLLSSSRSTSGTISV